MQLSNAVFRFKNNMQHIKVELDHGKDVVQSNLYTRALNGDALCYLKNVLPYVFLKSPLSEVEWDVVIFFHSLTVLRSTANAATAARSGPFCSAFGDEDGRDYAEAIQLRINPRFNFRVFGPVSPQYWIQRRSQNLRLSTEGRYVRLAVWPKDVFFFLFLASSPLVSGKEAQGRESFPSPPFCDNKKLKTQPRIACCTQE